DIAGKFGLQTGAQHRPALGGYRILGTLQHHCCSHITEDEVAIPVLPGQMGGADLRVHHYHATSTAVPDRVHRRLNAEGGGGTGHIHVVAPATLHTQIVLHFH